MLKFNVGLATICGPWAAEEYPTSDVRYTITNKLNKNNRYLAWLFRYHHIGKCKAVLSINAIAHVNGHACSGSGINKNCFFAGL